MPEQVTPGEYFQLSELEAYRGGRPPTARYLCNLFMDHCCSVRELLSRHSSHAQAVAATYKLLNELISDDDVFKV